MEIWKSGEQQFEFILKCFPKKKKLKHVRFIQFVITDQFQNCSNF